MFLTILLAVWLIVALATLAIGAVRRVGGAVLGGVIGLVVWIVAFLIATVTIVQATEVGVPVSFGKVGAPLHSGAHMVAPWTDVETLPIRPFSIPDIEVKARTGQGGSVTVTVGARWSVDANRANDTYLQVRTGDEDTISKDVVDKALAQATGNVYSHYDNGPAVSDRLTAEKDLAAELARLLTPYGIRVDNVFVRQSEPDADTSAAISRFTAQQNATRIADEANNTAVKEAARRLTEAKGLKDAANAIPNNLTEQQLQALCIQTWERQVAKATEAHVPLYSNPCTQGSPLAVSAK